MRSGLSASKIRPSVTTSICEYLFSAAKIAEIAVIPV